MNVKDLNNYSDWCFDKIVLTNENGKIIVNANTIMHIEEVSQGGSVVYCTEGIIFEVNETAETVLGRIKDLVSESKERKEAAKKADEERYAAMMAQAKEHKADA